ncbi:MAG: GTPase HflX [Dehalococcoidia bacterium]|nr:GTPase HflX [Dehalococcoidia bacterium]
MKTGRLIQTARTYPTAEPIERAYLVAVEMKGSHANGSPFSSESSLDELALLAETAGAQVVGRAVQKLESPHPAHYVGKGKLAEIKSQRGTAGYSLVIFDDELSPSQQRNLENALGVKVLDRTALILDIFAQRARTREGALQVELAQSEYLLPRLAGQWSHLERLEGAIGTRGPGETQLETDRRLVRNKIARLKRQIEAVRRQRALYRRRRARAGVPVIALVGYTNAGKSTLMRALSGADVFTEDKLFATLDPLTRRIALPGGGAVLLSDTVGFIQKLPTQLVAAFRATLEELEAAHVLVHVVDITHPDAALQSQTVEETLAELGLAEKPVISVLNKVDLLLRRDGSPVGGVDELREQAATLAYRPDALLISAEKGWGLDTLLERIETVLREGAAAPARPGSRWAPSRASAGGHQATVR